MPRYYCDYCDTYLTHDSVSLLTAASRAIATSLSNVLPSLSQQAGRKQHNRGWKHRENVKLYYEQFVAGQGGMMTRTTSPPSSLLALTTIGLYGRLPHVLSLLRNYSGRVAQGCAASRRAAPATHGHGRRRTRDVPAARTAAERDDGTSWSHDAAAAVRCVTSEWLETSGEEKLTNLAGGRWC